MRVSFDLDDVLLITADNVEKEELPPFPLNRIYRERLRKGTVRLIRELQKQGFEVWVYTSSYRPEPYIKRLFAIYGIRFDNIVNMQRHLKDVQRGHKEQLPQKMPGFYRISLHIDDEDAIIENGRRYGFRTLKVCEQDDQWVEKVLAEANRIRQIEESS